MRPLFVSYKPRLVSLVRSYTRSGNSPPILGSAPRAAEPPRFQSSLPPDNLFNYGPADAMSVVSVQRPKEAYLLNGIEVTRTMRLDAICWRGSRDDSFDSLAPEHQNEHEHDKTLSV